MPSEPPPSRYRVVERGRRLEVIDTLAGDAPSTPAPTPYAPSKRANLTLGPRPDPAGGGGLIERVGFDGRAVLNTRAWFDDKAPRRLWLDPGAAQRLDGARTVAIGVAVALAILIGFQPFLALLLLPLLSPKTRARLRGTTTAWLDRLDPAE